VIGVTFGEIVGLPGRLYAAGGGEPIRHCAEGVVVADKESDPMNVRSVKIHAPSAGLSEAEVEGPCRCHRPFLAGLCRTSTSEETAGRYTDATDLEGLTSETPLQSASGSLGE